MRSPAGWLCVLLIMIAVIATPILEKKLWEAKLARLRAIGFFSQFKPAKKRKIIHPWRAFFIMFGFITIPLIEARLWSQTLGRQRMFQRAFSPKLRTVYKLRRKTTHF